MWRPRLHGEGKVERSDEDAYDWDICGATEIEMSNYPALPGTYWVAFLWAGCSAPAAMPTWVQNSSR